MIPIFPNIFGTLEGFSDYPEQSNNESKENNVESNKPKEKEANNVKSNNSSENNSHLTPKNSKTKETGMKKIIVDSEKCCACGMCVNMTSYLQENSEGKAEPTPPGLIDENMVNTIQSVIDACPEDAISLEDDKVSSSEGTDKILNLREYIEKEIRDYEIKEPKRADISFNQSDYEVKINIDTYGGGYRSESKAESEGRSYFRDAAYSQMRSMIQSAAIQYKTKVLKKYAYYEAEEGNYYYDICQEISSRLAKAASMAASITNNTIKLPADFAEFKLGPDHGYDGSCCREIRELERYVHTKSDPASWYDTDIIVDGYDTYSYDISGAVKSLEQNVLFDVKTAIDPEKLIAGPLKTFKTEYRKLLNQKLSVLNNELKDKFKTEITAEDVDAKIKAGLEEAINNLQNLTMKKESVKSPTPEYRSLYEYDFKSRGNARAAGKNVLNEYRDEYREFLCNHYGDNIAELSAQKYCDQFIKLISNFRNDIQKVYDKYGRPYPNAKIEISHLGKYGSEEMYVSFNISSMDEIEVPQRFYWSLRNILESKLGYSNEYRSSVDYSYNDLEVREIYEDTNFWGKDIYTYSYGVDTDAMEKSFDKAVEKYINDLYASEYLNNTFKELKSQLAAEASLKLLKG